MFTVTAYADGDDREYSASSGAATSGRDPGPVRYLVAGKRRPGEPGLAVRGPTDGATKTRPRRQWLRPQEIRLLLDSVDTGDCSGLRDRALIGDDGLRVCARLGRGGQWT